MTKSAPATISTVPSIATLKGKAKRVALIERMAFTLFAVAQAWAERAENNVLSSEPITTREASCWEPTWKNSDQAEREPWRILARTVLSD